LAAEQNHCAADEEIDDEHHQNAAAHADFNAVNASRAEVLPDIRAKG